MVPDIFHTGPQNIISLLERHKRICWLASTGYNIFSVPLIITCNYNQHKINLYTFPIISFSPQSHEGVFLSPHFYILLIKLLINEGELNFFCPTTNFHPLTKKSLSFQTSHQNLNTHMHPSFHSPFQINSLASLYNYT